MSRKPFIAAALCLAFIVYATLCPIHDRPHLWGLHEPHWIAALERLAAFIALGLAARVAIPTAPSILLVLAAAIGLELLQNIIPHRDPRMLDAAIKVAGGMIGIIAAHLVVEWQRLSPVRPS